MLKTKVIAIALVVLMLTVSLIAVTAVAEAPTSPIKKSAPSTSDGKISIEAEETEDETYIIPLTEKRGEFFVTMNTPGGSHYLALVEKDDTYFIPGTDEVFQKDQIRYDASTESWYIDTGWADLPDGFDAC